jgi:hypothetical protein
MGGVEEFKDCVLNDIKVLNNRVTTYAQELCSKLKKLDNQIENKKKELAQLQSEETILRARLESLQFNEIQKEDANKTNCVSENGIKQLKSGTKMARINFLNNNTRKCPYCKYELIFDDISLAYYSHPSSMERKGFLKCKSLFCEKCKRHFLDENMRVDIKKRNRRFFIKENTSVNNHTSTAANTDFVIKRNPYKEEKENLNISNEYFDGLNPESQLHKLGYNVSKLNKEERWRILKYKVLPEMSIEAVISAIEFNISLREGYSKFASAVSAWKYDIQILQEYKRTGGWSGNSNQ